MIIVNKYNTKTGNLQSSPTGPAEHCAGGSRPKSCNSWEGTKKDKREWQTEPDPVVHDSVDTINCEALSTQH